MRTSQHRAGTGDHRRGVMGFASLAMCVGLVCLGFVADKSYGLQDGTGGEVAETAAEGVVIQVSEIQIRSVGQGSLDMEPLRELVVDLGVTPTGYVAPREGLEIESVALSEIAERPMLSFHAGALVYIAKQLAGEAVDQGMEGVLVVLDPADVSGVAVDQMRDMRDGRTTLGYLVYFPEEAKEEEVVVQPLGPADAEIDGPGFEISYFDLRYAIQEEHPGLPALEFLSAMPIELGKTTEGYVAPREGVAIVHLSLNEIALRPMEVFYASAIWYINDTIREELNAQGLIGIVVLTDGSQIGGGGAPGQWSQIEDLRAEDQKSLALHILTSFLSEVRSIASGDRVKTEDRISSPLHARIRRHSPVQPAERDEQGLIIGERRDLLRRDLIDDYLYRLNRHPGRRVSTAVAGGSDGPGSAVLDYLVTESRPWTVYFQISNTGTETTDIWRERFGFIHNQLTGRDDIFSIDFITSKFDQNNAAIGSYEAPVFDSERLRWRAYGAWSEFTAADVGQLGQDFTGSSWAGGAELIWNVFQYRDLFVDLKGGFRFQNIQVDNKLADQKGDETLFFSYIGADIERFSPTSNTSISAALEFFDAGMTNVDVDGLTNLGRLLPEDNWMVLKYSFEHSFYLEPLFFGKAWEDASTPASSTLAHEIALSVKGQWAFDTRLIPQAEQVVGGFYTVRGYAESVAAGDSTVVATAEYRFHLPRALGLDPDPGTLLGKPFRLRPQQVYGRPDWDLILRTFVDIGQATNSKRQVFEKDETLLSVGVGGEVSIMRNLNVRLDWGVVLDEVAGGTPDVVSTGSSRLHLSATLLF